MTRDEIITYCQHDYQATVDHPFKRYPDYVALRHPGGKWFGLLMQVPGDKLGLATAGEVEILNLKVDPELNSLLQLQPHFLPGYHMAKAHWISVLIGELVAVAEIADLIAGSYELTR